MNVFAAAMATLFRDQNLSVPAIYTPTGGAAQPLRILRASRVDRVAGDIAQFGAVAQQDRVELQATDVPVRPLAGATLAFEGRTLTLASNGTPARNGLTWSLTLRS